MSDNAALLAELAHVQALFQARAIATVMGLPAPTVLPTPTKFLAVVGEVKL